MNERQAIETAGRIGAFVARHLLAIVVTVTAACVLWTVIYLALLLCTRLAGGGLGSPASFPIGLLFILVAGTAVSMTLFLPATALSEWFARRRGFPIVAQIPISVAIFALLCFATASTTAALGFQPTLRSVFVSFGVLFAANLLPLGIYWWVVQSGPLLLTLFRRLRSIIR